MPSDHYPAPQDWERILEPGERLLWTGRPVPGIDWRDLISQGSMSGLGSIFFGLVWYMMTSGMVTNMADEMRVFGPGRRDPVMDTVLPLVPYIGLLIMAQGIWRLAGRPLMSLLGQGRAWYSLTNRRAFIARSRLGRKELQSWPLAEMERLDLIGGDPGDVIFAEERQTVVQTGRRGSRRTFERTRPVGFRRIREAQRVHQMINAQRRPETD